MASAAKLMRSPDVSQRSRVADHKRYLGTLLCPNCCAPIVGAYASETVNHGSVRHRWLCDNCDCDFATVGRDDVSASVPIKPVSDSSHNIRVTVADDHPLVLDGLRALIQAQGEFELVGEASDGLLAVEVIKEQRPDVAVVDISMPKVGGLDVARRTSQVHPSVRFVALTQNEDRAEIMRAFDAGMSGYVLKRSAGECLVHAITSVFTSGLYVDPTVDSQIFEDVRHRNVISLQHCNAQL